MNRSLILFGLLVVSAQPSFATGTDHLISRRRVGPVWLGMRVAVARKALKRFSLERTTDGDGVALIAVMHRKKPAMFLFAGETDPKSRIDEKAPIQSIEVTGHGYSTRAGVHPGMRLTTVERIYGRLTKIVMSEIESREYATFAKSPAGMTFRVEGKDGTAGVYHQSGSQTSRTSKSYLRSARLYSVGIG